jgi:hypothetical protein
MGGSAATSATLSTMAHAIRSAAMNEWVHYFAVDMVRQTYAGSKEDWIQAVKAFCLQNVMLVDEPEEILIEPVRMLHDIQAGRGAGDCDDITMLAATLLAALGVRTRLKAVFRAPEGHFQHVFLEYLLRAGEPWRPIDLTIYGIPVYPPDYIVEDI